MITFTAIRVCLVVLVILMLVYAYKAQNSAGVAVDPITQTEADWKSTPYVDIKVSNSECGTGEKSMLSFKWGETVEGCFNTDRGRAGKVRRGNRCGDERGRSTRGGFTGENKIKATEA
jgi:hypothetical protein